MVLDIRSGDEFMQEIIKIAEVAEDIVVDYDNKNEAMAYTVGTIGSLKVMALDLLEPEVSKDIIEYLDKKENELRNIALKLK